MGSKNSMAFLISLGLLALGTGCTNSSDEFSTVLDDSNGGRGTASIAVQSYSPGLSSVVVKATATQNFLVVAVGQGELRYTWTLDDVEVGSNLPTYSLNAALQTVGDKTLKVKINDEVGEVTQEWAVKINGTPVISVASPSASSVNLRRATQQTFSVTVTDPNSDTLTYVWKLDGEENVLTSTTGSQNWTPATVDVGNHTVVVDVYDGPASDSGTYKVTQSWTVYVNHFPSACNKMENDSETNKACVYVGIAGAGDGLNPETSASSIYQRPTGLAVTSEGNLFISHGASEHVIWFWNRATSPSVTVLGVTVPVNTMKVVAGAGVGSSGNSASNKALRSFLNTPEGLAWDGSNLYVADQGNNRVVRIDSNGVLTPILTAGCSQPRGVTLFGGYVYVACYNSHLVKKVDINSPYTSVTFAGDGTAGDPTDMLETVFTGVANARLRGPYGITSDASGNIYVSEYSGCRIRMYNQSGGGITLYGTYTISNNRQRIILGTSGAASCTNTNGEPVDLTATANARINSPRHLSLNSDGVLFIPQDSDRVTALNFANAVAPIVSGVTVPAYYAQTVFGSGTAGYIGEGGTASATRYNNPFAVVEDPVDGDYFIGDYDTYRLRKMKLSDGKSALIAGNGGQRTATQAGQSSVEAGNEKMSSIRGFAYDSLTGELFIADMSNNRIRVADRYGNITQAVGTGTLGTGGEENEVPTASTMNNPRNLTLTHATASYGGHLVWADTNNHRIRLYNRSSSDALVFGVQVDAGKVATIGGDGTQATGGGATSGAALQSAFDSPSGVAFDGTNLYVADTSNHCIKKIDSNGNLSALAGTCGTAGNVNGAVGVGRLNSPEGIAYYESGAHKGLVIADRGNGRVRFYRIAGSTSLLFGTTISVGDANSVACGGTFHTEGVNAALSPCSGVYSVTTLGSKFCFSNYTYHNVRCVESGGAISTVAGPVQGEDDLTAYFFPATSFSSADYDSGSPNYTSQNGVVATYIPTPIAEIPLATSHMKMSYPLPIIGVGTGTIFVGEYQMGLVRKVRVP